MSRSRPSRPRACLARTRWQRRYAAAYWGHCEALALLIEAGCDVDRPVPGQLATPLLAAAFNGRSRAAKALLDAGARPDGAAADGTTPLAVAAWHGDTNCARVLLEHGADPGAARRTDGATPLCVSRRRGILGGRRVARVDAAWFEAGPKPDARRGSGRSPSPPR